MGFIICGFKRADKGGITFATFRKKNECKTNGKQQIEY